MFYNKGERREERGERREEKGDIEVHNNNM